MNDILVTNGKPNGTPAILKWWPVIAVLLTLALGGMTGFFELRAEVVQSRTERVGQINMLQQQLIDHEKTQAEVQGEVKAQLSQYQAEQNRRLTALESKIDLLLQRR